jgi:hypothetical protein
MTKIFPDAKDYKTVNLKISNTQRQEIETAANVKLLPGQRDQFQYFEMTGANGIIGYLIAASQKGEYGAIEFVIGLDTNYTVIDTYIQRSREKDQSFKERAFLDIFKGITLTEYNKLPTIYKGLKTKGTDALINGFIKEFVSFKTLVQK